MDEESDAISLNDDLGERLVMVLSSETDDGNTASIAGGVYCQILQEILASDIAPLIEPLPFPRLRTQQWTKLQYHA